MKKKQAGIEEQEAWRQVCSFQAALKKSQIVRLAAKKRWSRRGSDEEESDWQS